MTKNIERSISYYERFGEKFIGEYVLDIDLKTIQSLWSPHENDPLYYMIYSVTMKQKKKIEELIGQQLDFENYEYFLECHSV